MAKSRCPICDKSFDSEASPAVPFCSARCRQIDLGRWLGEDYGVPMDRLSEEEGGFEDSPERDR